MNKQNDLTDSVAKDKRADGVRRGLLPLILAATAITVVAAFIQLSSGSYDITWSDVWRAATDSDVWGKPQFLMNLLLGDDLCSSCGDVDTSAISTKSLIIWNIRLPRILIALFVGINLSISGTIFQSITRNELASPYLLGVSSGSGLAIMVVLVVLPALSGQLPLIAMCGGIASFLIVYLIAWNHGTSPVRLILAGIIVGAISGSIQTALFFLAKDITIVQNAVAWTTGSLTGSGWEQVRMIAPWTVLALILAFCANRYLDLLLLGDQTAKSLGMRIERTRFILATVAILSASSAVAVAGLVGFIGLIVPHIVRSLAGSVHKRMLLGCVFVGPALLISADTVARLLLNPVQVPVGIVTGVVGGGFFLYLMRKKQEFAKL